MDLSPEENDALIEVCNIGMSKAARQLAVLLNDNVDISLPNVIVTTIEDAIDRLPLFSGQLTGSISQKLAGKLDGISILLFHKDNIQFLASVFTENTDIDSELSSEEIEKLAMSEIGNIIISSCFAALADLLGETVELSVPEYSENTAKNIILSENNKHSTDSNKKVVALSMLLHASKKDIEGTLVLILDINSLRLILDKLAEKTNY